MILPMENTEKMIFSGVGKYGIPEIKPETDIRIDKLEWIPVNYALTAKDKATKGVHFYKDDYQFERLWNNPDKYISLLQQFGAVCSPDFSLYSDMPLAVQLFMHYKKHWVAAYWQAHGIHVIPTLCWCGEQSYDWAQLHIGCDEDYKIYLKANGIYDVTWYPNFCPVCGRNLLRYRDHPEDDPRFAEQTLWLEHDLAMDE